MVQTIAKACPWYGYKKIALICERLDEPIAVRKVYRIMKEAGLLHRLKKRTEERARQEVARLYQLLPKRPNELWQTDVTFIPVAGYGWWYAITVIDYYSRYLLAAYLTDSYSAAEAVHALALARGEAERLCGPLQKRPFVVTDNGPSFIARRFGAYLKDLFSHVRIRYRTPTQLGLLERFHKTLKDEEIYWQMYDNPEHCRQCLAEFQDRYNRLRPHWALVPEGGGDPVTPQEVYVDGVATQIPKWQGWAKAAKAKLDEMREQAA